MKISEHLMMRLGASGENVVLRVDSGNTRWLTQKWKYMQRESKGASGNSKLKTYLAELRRRRERHGTFVLKGSRSRSGVAGESAAAAAGQTKSQPTRAMSTA